MKTTVLYYSKTGNTKQMAEIIAQGMESVEGVEAKCFSIDAIDEGWIKESSCVVLGAPIYMADVCGPAKVWFEGPSRKLALAGKLGGAFATADYLHGGGSIGVQTILSHMMVHGMLVYSGGFAWGQPIIHLGPVALKAHLEESKEVFQLYGQRMASKARELFD